ncbi:hypothetical protein T265_02213, partial [Opisthorchis viverrini]
DLLELYGLFKQANEGDNDTRDDDLLELYGLFKQANEGDNDTTAPFFIDFKAKAKWNAWNGRKGM